MFGNDQITRYNKSTNTLVTKLAGGDAVISITKQENDQNNANATDPNQVGNATTVPALNAAAALLKTMDRGGKLNPDTISGTIDQNLNAVK